jgi:hypothetical protein
MGTDAISHFFRRGGAFPPPGDTESRWHKAFAEQTVGDERGNNPAILTYQAVLPLAAGTERPLDWAETQNRLGNALGILGNRESGTARIEEAIAAFRAALEEYTRQRAAGLGQSFWQSGISPDAGRANQRRGNGPNGASANRVGTWSLARGRGRPCHSEERKAGASPFSGGWADCVQYMAARARTSHQNEPEQRSLFAGMSDRRSHGDLWRTIQRIRNDAEPILLDG